MDFRVNIKLEGFDKLEKALRMTPEAFEEGAENGILLATQDFVKDAKKIAPMDTGKLRKSIKRDSRITGSIKGKGWKRGTVRARAISDRGFDYSYYHEFDFPNSQYKEPTTPGTEPQYFQKTIKQNLKDYENVLSKEMRDALKRAGW